MSNTATLLKNWSGADNGSPSAEVARFSAAIDTLDQRTGLLNPSGVATIPAPIPIYTLVTLPSAATYVGRLIIVSDATPANSLCVSDGSNWKFVTFGSTVS